MYTEEDRNAVNVEYREGYGNTRRQLDRQNEVIDLVGRLVGLLEDRIDPVLLSPTPMPNGPEEDTQTLPVIPMTISSHTDRLDDIVRKLQIIIDRVDL